MPQVNDKITVKVNGRDRIFTISRISDFGDNPKARQSLIDRGWDGSWYWVDGQRGAHKLCYRAAASGRFELVL